MSGLDPWADFDSIRHNIKSHTVDRLKHIIQGLNEECSASISKSGKKQDLIDRITREFEAYRYQRAQDKWTKARAIVYQVKNTGSYQSQYQSISAGSYLASNQHTAYSHTPKDMSRSTASGSTSSTFGRYDPYAPPRRAVPGTTSPQSARNSSSTPIRFQPSPFFRVEQIVSGVQECPESAGNHDRKTAFLQFALTQDHITKLQEPNSKYQLRLFCTTSLFYTPNNFRPSTTPCLIEFPATCEVRVNNVTLTANLKGIKKKPGTAPPADLGDRVRKIAGSQNRIDIVYVNSSQGQQPPPPKKFYLVVMLLEMTPVDDLVKRLQRGKFRSREEIRSKMAKSAADDDDIEIGKQKMTLKCPLSYTRITTPCRSEKCVHTQCFDALSWYSVMEQTTTYMCPVCENVLNTEELIVDGYFAEILAQTPESVEGVEVEPDGEWHTDDNKYGSPAWIAKHPPKGAKPQASKRNSAASSNNAVPKAIASTSQLNGSRGANDVVVLDDSDEDEGRVKKELSPTMPLANGSRNASSGSLATSSVIDLTLDSDNEDKPPPVKRVEKRKADELAGGRVEVTQQKRPRVDEAHYPLPPPPRRDSSTHVNGASSSGGPPPWNGNQRASSSSSYQPPPPPPAPRNPPTERAYDSYRPSTTSDGYSYSNGSYQGGANGHGGHGVPYSQPNDRRLPPPVPYSNPYLPRVNGNETPRWP